MQAYTVYVMHKYGKTRQWYTAMFSFYMYNVSFQPNFMFIKHVLQAFYTHHLLSTCVQIGEDSDFCVHHQPFFSLLSRSA